MGAVVGCSSRSLLWTTTGMSAKGRVIPDSDEYAFGFLDPSLVLRGCHLLPAFADGKTTELLTMSTCSVTEARTSGEKDDWVNYYVGM